MAKKSPSGRSETSGPKPASENPLAKLPEETREKIVRAEIIENPDLLNDPKVQEAVLVSIKKTFKGPLPPSEEYAGYEAATPGAGFRMMDTADLAVKAQISWNERRLAGDFAEAGRGQIFGFIIAMTAILAGTYALVNGAEVGGTIIGGMGLSAVVYQFIQGKRR